MARPRKKGLGYFPLDTNFMSDRKIQRLAQQYGCNGICIYIAVLCEAYGENGYYACYDGDFCFDIGFTTGQDEKLVKEVIEFCVQIRLFDSELMEYRQILSSVGIQRRFEEISRRIAMQIDPAFNLLAPKTPRTPITVTKTGGRTASTGVITTETGVIATGTGVPATETPVCAAKTPEKGNGNKNKKTTTQKTGFYGYQSSNDHGEAARRAEILLMAQEATRGR